MLSFKYLHVLLWMSSLMTTGTATSQDSPLVVSRRGVRPKRKMVDSVYLWPDRTIPYTFLHPAPDHGAVMSGIRHWEQHTCLVFVHTANLTEPHIAFRRLEGCRSGVGREPPLGQNVSIGDTCTRLGIVVHEIGHAIGFYHEIRRPDRDDHVVINTDNILPKELFNFHKLHWIDTSVKYDLASVMHYTPMEWTANGRLSVATLDPLLQGVLGMWKGTASRGLSHRDKLLANTAYNCLERWQTGCGVTSDPCQGEGFLGAKCRCICPPGTAGEYCEQTIGDYYDDLRSPCSQEVNYDTVIRSPNYPYKYDRETWCVWVLRSDQCLAPTITILDFEFGPRDSRKHCTYDYLEIRTNSSSQGEVKCEKEVAPGTVFRAQGSTMILFFNGELGGYRGFEARLKFENIPGCCRKIVNGTTTHWLSPGYPKDPATPFECVVQQELLEPALVEVSLRALDNNADMCPLRLCLPDARCSQFCLSELTEPQVVLPNTGSRHLLSGRKAVQLILARKPSPCHKSITVGGAGKASSGVLEVMVPRQDHQSTMCEYKIQSPSGSHVQVTVTGTVILGRRAFLAVDESSDGRYGRNSTRLYRPGLAVPAHFVSTNNSLWLTLQGGPGTHLHLNYSLYECSDESPECLYWQLDGECQLNKDWMTGHCPRACHSCNLSVECSDRHPDCGFWAEHGQCEDNGRWMMVNCKRACGHCDRCGDLNPSCPDWATLGDCLRNPAYMRRHCALSCAFCDNGNDSTSTLMETVLEVPSKQAQPAKPNATTSEHAVRQSHTRIELEIDTVSRERSHMNEVTFGMEEENAAHYKNNQKNRMKRPDKNKLIQSGERRQSSHYDRLRVHKQNQQINRFSTTTPRSRKLAGRNSTRHSERSRNEIRAASNEVSRRMVGGQTPLSRKLINEKSVSLKQNSEPNKTTTNAPTTANTVEITDNESRYFPSRRKAARSNNTSEPVLNVVGNSTVNIVSNPVIMKQNSSHLTRERMNNKRPHYRQTHGQRIRKLTTNDTFKENDISRTLNKAEIISTEETNVEEFESNSVEVPTWKPPPTAQIVTPDRNSQSIKKTSSGHRKRSRTILARNRWRMPRNRHGHAPRDIIMEPAELTAPGRPFAKNRTITREEDNETTAVHPHRYQQRNSDVHPVEMTDQNIGVSSHHAKHRLDFRDFKDSSNRRSSERFATSSMNNQINGVNVQQPRVNIAGFAIIDGSSRRDKKVNKNNSDEAHQQPDVTQSPRLRIAGFVVPANFEKDQTKRPKISNNANGLHPFEPQNLNKVERVNSESEMNWTHEENSNTMTNENGSITDELDTISNELNTITNELDISFNKSVTITNDPKIVISEYEINTKHKNAHAFKIKLSDSIDVLQRIPSRISVNASFTSPTRNKPNTSSRNIEPKRDRNSNRNLHSRNSLSYPARYRSTRINKHRVVKQPVTNQLFEEANRNQAYNKSVTRKSPFTDIYSQSNISVSPSNESSANTSFSHLNSSNLRRNETLIREPNLQSIDKLNSSENSLNVQNARKPFVYANRSVVGGSRRPLSDVAKVQSLLESYRNRAAVVDAFMMLPLCSELRTLKPGPGTNVGPGNNNTMKLQRRSHRRKMRMYKLLKRILKPKFRKNPNSAQVLSRHRNPYHIRNFNRKLRRTLRKLYRKRKEKLRKYLFQNPNSLPMPLRRRGRKKKLIRYIRKYRLNKIFKLFKIRLLPFQYSETGSSAETAVPILCVAAKRGSTNT